MSGRGISSGAPVDDSDPVDPVGVSVQSGAGSSGNQYAKRELVDASLPPRAKARGIPPQGVKRPLVPSASEVKDHVDADINVPESLLTDVQAPSADASDPLGSLSVLKSELVEPVQEQLRRAYLQKGVRIEAADLSELSNMCVDMCCIEYDRAQKCAYDLNQCDVAGIYSPPRFTSKASSMGLRPGFCVDLSTTRADGTHWDLTRDQDARELEFLQRSEQPEILIGSPHCTDFCPLLHLHYSKHEIEQRIEAGDRVHMKRACEAYARQLELGKHFLHEHPAGSSSWHLPEVQSLVASGSCYLVEGPMCHWGLKVQDSQGRVGFVRKQTKWLTSSWELAQELSQECKCIERHVHLIGVPKQAMLCAEYTPKLVVAILRAFKRQLISDRKWSSLNSFSAGVVPEESEVISSESEFGESGEYWDDVHQVPLDAKEVESARKDELEWLDKQQTMYYVPESEPVQKGCKIHSMRWVDTRKKSGVVRSRIVVREIKRAKAPAEPLEPQEVFSAMPPVEALKMLVSEKMSSSASGDEELCIGVFDIKRAHFYGRVERDIYCYPPEGREKPGYVVKLARTVYGTQDASMIFQKTWHAHLRESGYSIGKANPALYFGHGVKGLCHGDDSIVLGTYANLLGFERMLQQKFELSRIGILGFGEQCDKQLEVLNRTLCADVPGDRITLEADTRHVPCLLQSLGLEKGKGVSTPRVKRSADEQVSQQWSPDLSSAQATLFRSGTMRIAYLAQDRVDLSEACKCLSRYMAKPKECHLSGLKKVARYLKFRPCMYQSFVRQSPDTPLICHVDSDWAGDAVTRRSTTGMIIRRGRHLLRHSSTLQSSVSLSSAEAEYYALTTGVAYSLGVQSH